MDTTDSKIIFDQNGICDHCNTFYKKILPTWDMIRNDKSYLENELIKIKAKSKRKDYDCII